MTANSEYRLKGLQIYFSIVNLQEKKNDTGHVDNQLIALDDPRGFLKTYPDKTIFDEVQRVPDLFSYLQTHVDNENKEGMYVIYNGDRGFATSFGGVIPWSDLSFQ